LADFPQSALGSSHHSYRHDQHREIVNGASVEIVLGGLMNFSDDRLHFVVARCQGWRLLPSDHGSSPVFDVYGRYGRYRHFRALCMRARAHTAGKQQCLPYLPYR